MQSVELETQDQELQQAALLITSNRAMLDYHLAHASFAASPQFPSAFLLIDLDNFRSVNHALGHDAGDALLALISWRLHDAVECDDAFSYMGGDEFGFVLHGLRDPAEAATVAKRLLAAIEAPFHVAGRELRISASIGISVCPTDCVEVSDIRRCAEAAMYCVKQQGRNGFQFYAPAMIAEAEEQVSLAGDLRHAIERNELELHYQPQVTAGGDLVGFEALLRWHHPVRGDVPPSLFIPIAEASGMILPIGEWVLLEACRQCGAWQSPGDPPVKVAVNVSVAQFLKSDFYDLVIGAIELFGIKPGRLELEITESLLVIDNRAAGEKLAALRSAGVRIAIDDFGTGYSSLAYLQRLPIDSLKIDRTFVSAITAGTSRAGRRSAIVRAVTTLACDLGMSVTAEGVETPEQQKYLSEIGCHHLQGYLFGSPCKMPRSFWNNTANHERGESEATGSCSSFATCRGNRGVLP